MNPTPTTDYLNKVSAGREGLRRYLPDIAVGYIPGERFSILRHKVKGITPMGLLRGPGCDADKLVGLIGGQLRQCGVTSKRQLHYLCDRPHVIRQVESIVFGIASNFALSYPELFESAHKRTWYSLVRWIFRVGTYSTQEVIDCWKDYSLAFLQHSQDSLIARRAQRTNSWFYSRPLDLGLQSVLDDLRDPSRGGYSRILTLTNTRNLPVGSAKKEGQALERHKINMQRAYTGNPLPFGTMAGAVGYEVRDRVSMALRSGHISLSGSASFFESRAEGGRALEAALAFKKWALHVPSEDLEEIDIWGRVYTEKAGYPRWKTAYREDPDEIYGEFCELNPETLVASHYGLDGVVGLQLLKCPTMRGKSGCLRCPQFLAGSALSPSQGEKFA
jgi:hypothetical protein